MSTLHPDDDRLVIIYNSYPNMLLGNIRYAVRVLRRTPGFTITVVLMLALGIGATTAIFSLFHQVLVRPLPVPEPERLVNIVRAGPEPVFRRESMSYPMSRDLEERQTAFAGIAVHAPFTANLTYRGQALSVPGVSVSGRYFEVLNLKPALGRLIGPQDEPRIDESPVVVLSDGLWQSRFGADPNVIGQTLAINGQSLTIVGVTPASFSGTQLGNRVQLFVPITMRWLLDPSLPRDFVSNRNFSWVRLFARLAPGVSVEQASAGINTVYGRILNDVEAPLRTMLADELQQFLQGQLELVPGTRGQGTIPGAARSLTLLLGVTALVLLIVCVNIANLLLARGAARAGEMAIREAMGASRGRLLAQLLTETAVLAAIGGFLSLPVATLTLGAITPILPPRLADGFAMQLSPTAALFAAAVTIATALVSGLFPALRATRTNPALAMKGHALQALGGGRGTQRVRGVLVTAQIAFSMVLLVLAGLFAQSLLNVARIDLGIEVDSLVSFSVSPRLNGYSQERALTLYERVGEELAALPGVTGATSASVPVISGSNMQLAVFVEGFDNNGQPAAVNANMVGPSFFETLSIPLRAGREFTTTDTASSPRVAIVNERFARQFGLGDGAIGKRLNPDGDGGIEIVGVVADAAYSAVKSEIPPQYFLPWRQPFFSEPTSLSFYVRANMGADALLPMIPRAIAAVDPTLPVNNLITMRRQVQESVFLDRLVTILSTGFAGLATLLAAIGLYGVLAYNVTQRTRELGLRLALGAEPGNLRAMVLKQVASMALIGIAIGLVVALGFGRIAEALLFGLSSRDPRVLAAAAVVLALVVLAASYLPARRASSIAPMEALRHE